MRFQAVFAVDLVLLLQNKVLALEKAKFLLLPGKQFPQTASDFIRKGVSKTLRNLSQVVALLHIRNYLLLHYLHDHLHLNHHIAR